MEVPVRLITLERARGVPPADGEAKLTVYLGRGEAPGHRAVVELLRRHGVAGATLLLEVDGTVRGRRERARFFAANAGVPLMLIAVGRRERVAAALHDLRDVFPRALTTLERVDVLKRDGVLVGRPPTFVRADPSRLRTWQKLMVFCGEQSRHRGRPLHAELIRDLRAAGAAGATALRGVWGFHGDHRPHGDVLWQLRRRVPAVVVVDVPERFGRLFDVVDGLTDETGLVTSELGRRCARALATAPRAAFAVLRRSSREEAPPALPASPIDPGPERVAAPRGRAPRGSRRPGLRSAWRVDRLYDALSATPGSKQQCGPDALGAKRPTPAPRPTAPAPPPASPAPGRRRRSPPTRRPRAARRPSPRPPAAPR